MQATSVTRPGPLSDAVIAAVAGLFGSEREPTHSTHDFHVQRAGLRHVDPAKDRAIGKEKRVREILTWAIEHDPERGGQLVGFLVAALRGCGGFRPDSPNSSAFRTSRTRARPSAPKVTSWRATATCVRSCSTASVGQN